MKTIRSLVTEASLSTPTNSAVALFVGAFTSDYRPALAKINKPALIIAAQSPWVTTYQDMQKRILGSRMEVLENVGHALFVDDADRFNSLLEDFVNARADLRTSSSRRILLLGSLPAFSARSVLGLSASILCVLCASVPSVLSF